MMTTGASRHQPSLISGVVSASVDVRRACNGIKRAASLSSASILTGLDGKFAAELAHQMAMDVLRGIGFDTADEQRLAAVLPMMIEATSLVLSDAAKTAEHPLSGELLAQAAKTGVATMVEVAKSRAVAKMVEPAYPTDMDSVIAMRMSAAAAMSIVAVEIAEFDFVHRPQDCMKEAGKTVVKAALQAAAVLSPRNASASSRLMLSQSLTQSAARVYAAAWKSVAYELAAELDGTPEAEREAKLDAMGATALSKLLEPVEDRFRAAFQTISECACALIEDDRAPERDTKPEAAMRRPAAKVR